MIAALSIGLAGATTAHGEPSCGTTATANGFFGVVPRDTSTTTEAQCRTANEQVAGPHTERAFWTQVAGAPYPEVAVPSDSTTPYEADLFAVRFRNSKQGFAGGASCKGPTEPSEVEGCERVPVIYANDEDTGWQESYRADSKGYVGAIAWIAKGKALAVGGTGTYPRREPNPIGSEWDYDKRLEYDRENGAGDARAWVFSDGSWSEISDTLPPEMGGLTALDVWIGREEDEDEWGLAGDYGHIWEWEGGRFTGSHIDNESEGIGASDPEWSVVDGPTSYTENCVPEPCRWNPSAETSDASFFEYRVREIRFAPDRSQKRAIAFTAGCCGPDANADGRSDGSARRLEFVAQPRKDASGVIPPDAPPREGRPHWIVSSATYGDKVNDSVYSFALKPSRYSSRIGDGNQLNDRFGEPHPPQGSLIWGAGATVNAPGRDARGATSGATPDPTAPAPQPFVASDGDTERIPGDGTGTPGFTGNGIPDWLAGGGAPDSEEPGIGLLQTTVTAMRPEYGGLRPYCPSESGGELEVGTGPPPALLGGTRPNTEAGDWIGETRFCRAEQIQTGNTPTLDRDGPLRTRESGLQAGPSYSLNSIDMLDSENVGYAVGDHGAIMRFGEPPVESDPPSLGSRRSAQLADDSPYDERRAKLPESVGPVPSLGMQARETRTEPALVRAGSPDANRLDTTQPPEDVHTIVMSRDGAEGWAIGPTREGAGPVGIMTLHHYRAGRWTRCDPLGIPGIVEPDPECEDLAPLYKSQSAEQAKGKIRLDVAARVPLEYDDDPSNDDELEILAIGNPTDTYRHSDLGFRWVPTIIRYSEGRWALEEFATRDSLDGPIGTGTPASFRATSLACVARDECWATGIPTGSGGDPNATQNLLRRFDGQRWIDCSKTTSAPTANPLPRAELCGDPDKRIGALNFSAQFRVTSAGERIFLGAHRSAKQGLLNFGGPQADRIGSAAANAAAPAILVKDAGPEEQWTDDGGGFDPAFSDPAATPGTIATLSVAQRPDGTYEGWATGRFEGPVAGVVHDWPLMRLDPQSSEWDVWRVRDAAYDALMPRGSVLGGESPTPYRHATVPGSGSEPARSYIASLNLSSAGLPSRLVTFDPGQGRWVMAEQPGPSAWDHRGSIFIALAPDNRGGLWAALGTGDRVVASSGRSDTYYYNYTRTPPREVFTEADHPLAPSETLTDLTAGGDGSVWVTTDKGRLYRRDRITGWQRVEVPGWDPGRVVTSRSSVSAVAIGPDGDGLAVGEDGRIAQVGPAGIMLDPAAGVVCGQRPPPCGTSFDLHSVAIVPDGAAMVGGDSLALLARDSGGDFQRIASPDAAPAAKITGISYPKPGEAWLSLDSGQVFSGTGSGGQWRWKLENTAEVQGVDRLLTEDRRGEVVALRDIAVDSSGHGFAVGDKGVILERTGDDTQPWRRVPSGVTEQLTSVALPIGEGPGALAGGEAGMVLTWNGSEWQTARPGDQLRPDSGHVAGVALLPGSTENQAEAWAGTGEVLNDDQFRRPTSQVLHYTSAPDAPQANLAGGSDPLSDAPTPRAGELSFAAFGRSDCQFASVQSQYPCKPHFNGPDPEQVLLRRIRDEVLERSGEPGGPDFTLFTGDAYDTASAAGVEPVEQNNRQAGTTVHGLHGASGLFHTFYTGAEKYRRFNEQVTDFLPSRGLPFFAAIGARDLSENRACANSTVGPATCAENRDRARAGENLVWRQTMEDQPAPWGAGEPATSDELAFEPVGAEGLAVRNDDHEVDDPSDEVGPFDNPSDDLPESELPSDPVPATGTGTAHEVVNDALPDSTRGEKGADFGGKETAGPRPIPTGGASTHYAADILSTESEEPVARLVVVDTSLGSLSASDPIQQPIEADGGQAAWLERVLCIEGSISDTGQCTREPSQQAIVLSNAPTYSYGPTDPSENQTDATVFESILLRHRANVVVSGKLGWNGRYWATAPGVHEPCPGGTYIPDENAPTAGTRVCGQGAPAGLPNPEQVGGDVQRQATELASGAGGQGILPFVVASGAGGRFNSFAERAGASASEGLWHGYSIVRLDPSGDPRKTIVEQRPILDWIGITSRTGQRVLSARQRLRLEGRGRQPITPPVGIVPGGTRFVELDSPAITHRYDLVLADPDEPWSPCEASDPACTKLSEGLERSGSAEGTSTSDEANPCAPYLCLSNRIGTIDRYSGELRAGDGKYPDTFAIALLSVDERVATYPLVFKKSPSFVAKSASLIRPLPQAQKLQSPEPPPPVDPPPTPRVPHIEIPAIPPPPGIPPLTAAAPPELQPPAPPAPPPPSQQPTPLDLTVAPPGVSLSTPTALIQPPTPPVNPAPPGGARKEARQRQAAAQKGGADSSEQSEETQGGGGDLAQGRPDNANAASRHEYTRHNLDFAARARTRPEPSFTTLSRSEPSAGAQGVLYGGGIALAAAVLALGFSTLRPTPRRRQPEIPAPARSVARSHRR